MSDKNITINLPSGQAIWLHRLLQDAITESKQRGRPATPPPPPPKNTDFQKGYAQGFRDATCPACGGDGTPMGCGECGE